MPRGIYLRTKENTRQPKVHHKNCKHCGKDFIPLNKNWKRVQYCSKVCGGLHNKDFHLKKIAEGRQGERYKAAMKRLGLARKGAGHPRWIKDRTIILERHRFRNSPEYKEWRYIVYKRDGYACQECGIIGGELEAHHVIPQRQDKTKSLDPKNGITLCRKCHLKTMGGKENLFEKKYREIIDHNILYSRVKI